MKISLSQAVLSLKRNRVVLNLIRVERDFKFAVCVQSDLASVLECMTNRMY